MKVEIDSFSGNKIYPGRGSLFVRADSKIFRFYSSKTASLFFQRKNPRRISWTVSFRKQRSKGVTEEVETKTVRKAVKHQRAVVGASLELIRERRAMRPEARKATREQAIKDGKQKKAEAAGRRKADKAVNAASGSVVSKKA